MSALDKAVSELDAKRSKDDAERRARQQSTGVDAGEQAGRRRFDVAFDPDDLTGEERRARHP